MKFEDITEAPRGMDGDHHEVEIHRSSQPTDSGR